jgi:hypothetical protein
VVIDVTFYVGVAGNGERTNDDNRIDVPTRVRCPRDVVATPGAGTQAVGLAPPSAAAARYSG